MEKRHSAQEAGDVCLSPTTDAFSTAEATCQVVAYVQMPAWVAILRKLAKSIQQKAIHTTKELGV